MHKRLLTVAITLTLVMALPAVAFAADPCAAGGEWDQYLARGWLWMYLGAFGFGFLTSLTPCVYPMIPIVVGVFGARDESVTRLKAFALATAYVLGMGVMYAFLGVIFALLGKQFGTILADPWVVVPLVAFYGVLAASMFGAFDLNLPASWQARLNQVGGRGYGGAFGMGLVGGLTAAPCTGPFLAGILGFVATSRDVLGGSTLLFSYAIGMGVLFWVIAAFAVSLPRSGRWMEWIKSVGGIALLAVGVHFLRPIVPAIDATNSSSLYVLAGAVALLFIGVGLGAVHLSFSDTWPVRVRKGAGVLLMVAGITGVVGWVLTPDRHLPWQYDEEAAFARARAEGKGVMIDFAADWCMPCKELELTFAAGDVYDHITESFVPLKFDVSKGTDEDDALQARWRAQTLPAVIFVDAQGRELGRVSEYKPPAAFLEVLEPAARRVRGGADVPCPAESAAQATSLAPPAPAQPAATAAAPAAPLPVVTPLGAADIVPSAIAPRPVVTPLAAAPAAPAAPAAQPAEPEAAPALQWVADDVEGFLAAEAAGKGVLIDFYAAWCPPCIAMKTTFADQEVARVISASYVPVHLDVTRMTDADQIKLEGYKVKDLPTMVFLDVEGNERARITTFVEPDELLTVLSGVAAN